MSHIFIAALRNPNRTSMSENYKRFFAVLLAAALMTTIGPVLSPASANEAGNTVTFHSNYQNGQADYSQTSANQTGLIPNQFVRPLYTFQYWSTNSGKDGSGLGVIYNYTDKNLYPFSQNNSDLYAQWSRNTYTITFDATTNGGSAISPLTRAVNTGEAVGILPIPTLRPGYTFIGWFTAASVGDLVTDQTVPTAAATYFARWTANTDNAIIWNANGGVSESAGPTVYTTALSIGSLPGTTSKAGYSFAGWWADPTFTTGSPIDGSYTPTTPYGDITFYAKWDARTDNAISWDDQSPTTASSGGSATYTTAQLVSTIPPTEPKKDGYTFTGWWTGTNGAGTQVTDGSFTPTTPYGAITFYAKWFTNTDNAIIWNTNGGVSATAGPATYTTGLSILSLPVTTTSSGYTFAGWWVDPTFATGTPIDGSYTPNTPYGAVTFYAKWDVNAIIATETISITYQANGGTSLIPTQTNIGTGGLFVVGSTMNRAGYTFGGWKDQNAVLYQSGDMYYSGNSNVVFTAQWSATNQSVTYSAGSGSGVVPVQANVPTAGTFFVASGVAMSKPLYKFVGWTDGTNNYLPGSTYTMGINNVTLTAFYSINYYELSYATDGNGSISGLTQQTVNHGNNGSAVIATALAGYRFVSWSDGVLASTRSEINVVASMFARAQFTAITFTVTYTAGPNGSINGSSTQVVQYSGTSTSVTATPETGYRFTGWSDGNINATRTDGNITSALSVTANFELIPPLVVQEFSAETPAETPAPSPEPVLPPQVVVETAKTSCSKPIIIDLSSNLAPDGSSKVEISRLPKNGKLVQTSATTWTFTPSKNSCSLGGNDSIVIKITDASGVVTTVTNNVVIVKNGDVPSAIKGGVASSKSENNSNIPLVPELLGFTFLVLFSNLQRKFQKKRSLINK